MNRSVVTALTALLVLALTPPGSRARSAVIFEDIAQKIGVTAPHTSSPEKRYILESMSGGVGLIDFDNDGDLDIVMVNGSSIERYRKGGDRLVTLYRQDSPLTFVDATEAAHLVTRGWGMGVAAGDFDNDGAIDLFVTGYGANALFRNTGRGIFEDVTERTGLRGGGFSAGAAWADYDRDGRLDLFVARYVFVDLDHLPEFGRDEFCRYRNIYVQCGPGGLPGESDFLYHNRGDGTFTEVGLKAGVGDPQKYYGLGAIWSDYDDDGWPDLYVANDTKPNYLYRNRRDGTFEDVSLLSGTAFSSEGKALGSMGLDSGDYDRDGRLDFFVTNYSEQSDVLYRNLGDEGFAEMSWAAKLGPANFFQVGWGTDFFDYDADGWPDLLIVNGHVYPQIDAADVGTKYRQPMVLDHNRRDGTFEDVTDASGLAGLPLASRRGAAFGDLDNDGDIDVVILNIGEPPTVLRNIGPVGHRAMFQLDASTSNRSAIGARVVVKTGDLVQTDEMHGGSSYLSQNDLRLHFGLGDRVRMESVEVRWPNGAVERFTDLPADQVFTITEGKGVTTSRPLPALNK